MSATRGWMLAAAAGMSLAAMGLAPIVGRYWSERLGASDREQRATALPLQPVHVAPQGESNPARPRSPRSPARAERSGQQPAKLRPEPATQLEEDSGAAADPTGEPSAELPSPSILATPGEAAPAAPPRLLDESLTHGEGHAAFPPDEASEPPSPEPAQEAVPTRRVSITLLEARTRPGLCKGSNEALDARARLVARFQARSWDGTSLIYLDPRLSPGVAATLLADLEQAESEISRVLRLAPPRPNVFAYYDTQLLIAGGCTNENVVAYYDGALHVVPSHEDVAQSILHEYTHHALTATGLLGPAWAQEGIAMHMADETWWRGAWMASVLARPFSLEVMESAVPYTLRSDQAGLFYAQSAAMVACSIRGDPRGLEGLVESLAAGNEMDELSYQLPSAAAPAAWRGCFTDLAR